MLYKEFLLKAVLKVKGTRTSPTCSFCPDQEVLLFSDYNLPWLSSAPAFEC